MEDLDKSGPFSVYFEPEDGKQVPFGRAQIHDVQVYSTRGTFGLAPKWEDIAEATLDELNQFLNDRLAANSKQ